MAQKQRAKEKKKEHVADHEAPKEDTAHASKQAADTAVEKPTPSQDATANEPIHPAANPDATPSTSTEPEHTEQDVSSRKRKLSTDDKEEDESAKKHKSNESDTFKRPIAPFKAKPRSIRPNTRRGKSVKLPQKTLSRNDVQTIKEANAKEDKQEDAPEKTNDDFRAMLLASKK